MCIGNLYSLKQTIINLKMVFEFKALDIVPFISSIEFEALKNSGGVTGNGCCFISKHCFLGGIEGGPVNSFARNLL